MFRFFQHPIPVLVLSLILWAVASPTAAQKHSGLVVEEVTEGGSMAAAGVEPGDQLFSWSTCELSGRLESIFDWWVLAHGEAWRHSIQLVGKHDGRPVTFQVQRGDWGARLRPILPTELATADWITTEPAPCSEIADGEMWRAFFDRLEPYRLDRPDLLAWAMLERNKALTRCSPGTADLSVDRDQLETVARPLTSEFQRIAFWFLVSEAYRGVGRRDLGLEFLRRAQEECADEKPHLLWASVALSLSYELLKTKDLEAAEHQTEAALIATRAQVSGSLLEARILRRLGDIREHQGALDAANRHFRDSLEILEPLEVTAEELARGWRNLGIIRAKQGNLKEAQLNFERALEWGQRIAEPNTMMGNILNNLGMVAYSRGDLDKAQRFLLEAQSRKIAAAGSRVVAPSTLVNLGLIAIEREDYSSAEEYFQQALTIEQQRDPASLGMATLLNNLGRVKRLLGATTEARQRHEQALVIQRRITPSSLAVSESLERLAQVDEAESRWQAAATGYQQAQTLRESLAPSTSRNAILLGRMAHLARGRGQIAAASSFYRRAVALVEERLEDLGGSHEQRQGFQSLFGPLFRDYAEVLVESGHTAVAFELQERSRARIFREMLAERDLDLDKNLPEAWAQERQALAGRYDEILVEIASSADPLDGTEALRLNQELVEVRWRRDELLERVRQHSPRLATLKYPRALDVAEIQATLDPGTLLLAYSVNESSSLIFALSKKEGLEVRRLPVGETQLRQDVEGLLSLIQQGAAFTSRRASLRAASLRAAGQRLFDQLLKPYEDRIGRAQRLLVLPDGPLYQLPFAALVRELPSQQPSSSESVGRRWQYLLEWKPVHFALSASLYAELRAHRAPPPADWPLVAFGAPMFQGIPVTGSAVALKDLGPVSPGRPGFELPELPATREEVERIAALFQGGRVYVGAEVTEERVRELPPRVGLLHFATHVRLDERHPLDSALVLSAPEPRDDGQANGLLQVWEIFEGVRVDAEMVVLSACESALGREVQGEGLIGLTRAFHFAGARSVVASLWPVADAATAELMVRFYGHLCLGRSKDEALRAAQLELLGGAIGPETTAPYYWAAFQLSGDWSADTCD